jgi:hypothetical protein
MCLATNNTSTLRAPRGHAARLASLHHVRDALNLAAALVCPSSAAPFKLRRCVHAACGLCTGLHAVFGHRLHVESAIEGLVACAERRSPRSAVRNDVPALPVAQYMSAQKSCRASWNWQENVNSVEDFIHSQCWTLTADVKADPTRKSSSESLARESLASARFMSRVMVWQEGPKPSASLR